MTTILCLKPIWECFDWVDGKADAPSDKTPLAALKIHLRRGAYVSGRFYKELQQRIVPRQPRYLIERAVQTQ